MAIKKLVEVWDGKELIENNISFLKQTTKEVRLPLSEQNKKILEDLKDTYNITPCAGIAANQIGYDKRIFIGLKHDDYNVEEDEKKDSKDVIGNPNNDNYEFYINPQIDHSSKKSIQEGEEGCLSIPEIRLIAERFDKIKVRYYNENGKKIKKPLSGFISRLYQHELDHLNGNLMLEHNNIADAKIFQKDEQYSDLLRQVFEYINN